MFVAIQSLVLSLALAGSSVPSCASHSKAFRAKPESTQESELEKLASELKAELGKVVDQNADLLKNPWLRYATAHFGLAEQAVKSLVVNGKPNTVATADFHYGLSSFVRALEELPKWEPSSSGWGEVTGTAKGAKRVDKPQSKQLDAMAKALKAIEAKANRSPAFEAPGRVTFDESTTPAAAAEYGSCVMITIGRMLYEGTLEQVTCEGKAKTTNVMNEPLTELKSALASLAVQEEAEQNPEKAVSALAHSIGRVKQGVVQVRKALDELMRYHSQATPRVELVKSWRNVLSVIHNY